MRAEVVYTVEADGYTVVSSWASTGAVIEEYHAGNHPQDSTQRIPVDHPRAAGQHTLGLWAKQTAEEMRDELERDGHSARVVEGES